MNLWEDHPEVRALTFNTRIAQAPAELIGAQALRLWHDQALYKEAGARQTDCHRDQPDWPIAETNTITAWIPLEGSTVGSGDDLIVEPPPLPTSMSCSRKHASQCLR